MENIFELVVFFITAVIFIVSAITKQKKKTNQQTHTSGMDNLVESFFGITEDTVEEPQVEAEQTFNEAPVDRTKKVVYNNKIAKETEKDVPNKRFVTPSEEKEEEAIDFDLRQAIIYSEILNRKHF